MCEKKSFVTDVFKYMKGWIMVYSSWFYTNKMQGEYTEEFQNFFLKGNAYMQFMTIINFTDEIVGTTYN